MFTKLAITSFGLAALSLSACGGGRIDGNGGVAQAAAGLTGPSAVETVPPDEAEATAAVVDLISEQVRQDFASSPDHTARRDAHAKHHGCVKAKVAVDDGLPPELGVGLFAQPASYDAWIRYSNGNGKVRNDQEGDGRGMAVKLVGVPGDKILDGAEHTAVTQDFLMINHPTFFVRNAADYVDFQSVVATDGDPRRFFFPSLNPFSWRLHELSVANAIRNKKIGSPLDIQYFSMAPYLLGTRAVKYSARPCTPVPAPSSLPASPNYLREAMAAELAEKPACFELLVQLQKDARRQPIEDPSIEWSESEAPFRKVATITIPQQSFDSPAQMTYCENLSMNPWHALPEQRPLGGINRVRRTVYDTISKLRHELNGAARVEPTDLSLPGQP
jgi:hypothetical protein